MATSVTSVWHSAQIMSIQMTDVPAGERLSLKKNTTRTSTHAALSAFGQVLCTQFNMNDEKVIQSVQCNTITFDVSLCLHQISADSLTHFFSTCSTGRVADILRSETLLVPPFADK